MPKTILFVPWSLHQDPPVSGDTLPGMEYAGKNNLWLQHLDQKHGGEEAARKSGNESYQVWYSGKTSPLLSGMTDGQIYIRGHSLDSLGEIFSGEKNQRDRYGMRVGNPAAERLTADQVAGRLIETGLSANFAGKLKCYNCWGAVGGKEGFAQKFADVMWDKGFKNCTFFGYKGAAASFPDPLTGHKTVLLADKTEVRASSSEGREQIVPSQAKTK